MNLLQELWTGRSPGPQNSAQDTTSEDEGAKKAQCSSLGPIQDQKRSRLTSSEGTASVKKRAKKAKEAQCSFTDSTWYAWYLVCETMCYQKKVDLTSLCLVSKSMKDLATPFLYRSLIFNVSHDFLMDALLCRLLDTPRNSLRSFVQEITIHFQSTRGSNKWSVSMLIERLPNLRLVRFEIPCDFSEEFMNSIDQHPRKPELHLLAENGNKPYPRSLPRVTVIKVRATNHYSYDEGRPDPPQSHDFMKFITSCPNLKSCSWRVMNPKKTIIRQEPSDLEEFDTEIPFPNLEHLALDGHYLGSQMSRGWQDHFNWSCLSSLEIGGQPFALENLKLMPGHLMNLKSLKVIGHHVQKEDLDRSLECFLMSFDTLVNLTLLNCSVPVDIISRHTRLGSLCVHIRETWDCLDSRAVYENIDILSLDALCPLLENLELDIERDNIRKEWTHDVLDSLARGFPRLKTLALHSRVGTLMRRHPMSSREAWRKDDHSFQPELTYKTAKEIGSKFFGARHDTLLRYGRFQKLTLKAGLNKELPSYARTNSTQRDWQFNTLTFDMFPPENLGQELKLVHLERERQEELCQGVKHPRPHRILEQIIEIAEWGPRYPFIISCGSKTHCRRGVIVRAPERRSERIAQRRAREQMVD